MKQQRRLELESLAESIERSQLNRYGQLQRKENRLGKEAETAHVRILT